MALKILVVFATAGEAEILSKIHGIRHGEYGYRLRDMELNVLITGVGGISTAWTMKQWLCNNYRPDLAVNAGIAGSYTEKYPKGDVVIPVSDCFADMGSETDSKFLTLAEAGLMNPDDFPFKRGSIISDNRFVEKALLLLPGVKAITVNTASGTISTIERLKKKYDPDIETMEGATFFYICAREKIPFLAIRAISNFVEPGNRKTWDLALALENLAGKLNDVLLTLE